MSFLLMNWFNHLLAEHSLKPELNKGISLQFLLIHF